MLHYHAIISFAGFKPISRFFIGDTLDSIFLDLDVNVMNERNRINSEHIQDTFKPVATLMEVRLTIIQ